MNYEMNNVMALQALDVEQEELGLCFSMASTTSTASSWNPPQ